MASYTTNHAKRYKNETEIDIYRPAYDDVTQIDLDFGLQLKSNISGNGLWKIEERLEELDCEKKTFYNVYANVIDKIYKVPIIGYIKIKGEIAYHRDKKKNPNKVYLIKNDIVTRKDIIESNFKLCGEYSSSFPDEIEKEFPDAFCIFDAKKDKSKRTFQWYGGYSDFCATDNYDTFDINLKSEQEVVAFTITPRRFKVYEFPTQEWFEEYDEQNCYYDGNKFNILHENVIQKCYDFITVYFRNKGGKWVKLETIPGPRNDFHERVYMLKDFNGVDKSLITQHLRFVVEDNNVEKHQGMTINVYAIPSKNCEKLEYYTKTEDEKLVTYMISKPYFQGNKVNKGQSLERWALGRDPKYKKAKKAQNMTKKLQNEKIILTPGAKFSQIDKGRNNNN